MTVQAQKGAGTMVHQEQGKGTVIDLTEEAFKALTGGGGPIGPQGACCVGTVCSIKTAAACAAAGGTYMGDGTTCTPVNLCLPTCAVTLKSKCESASWSKCGLSDMVTNDLPIYLNGAYSGSGNAHIYNSAHVLIQDWTASGIAMSQVVDPYTCQRTCVSCGGSFDRTIGGTCHNTLSCPGYTNPAFPLDCTPSAGGTCYGGLGTCCLPIISSGKVRSKVWQNPSLCTAGLSTTGTVKSYTCSDSRSGLACGAAGNTCDETWSETWTLSNEYTTALLKTVTVTKLAGDGLFHPGDCNAYADLSADESTYSIQRMVYKFVLSSPLANNVKITWKEHSTLTGNTSKSEIITAGSTTGIEHTINEPSVVAGQNDTISIINIDCRELV
jgi:hypothetical protein